MDLLDTPLPLLVFWLFCAGAAVGSFLNVVIYRLPHGISLVYPPSHCPKCATPIRWYDNVPIFGWIMLRGRCRQCHNPISARYPIVETVTAVMFAALGAVELPELLAFYPGQVMLLCTLLCAGLMEYDGKQPPWRLYVPAVVVGIGLQMFLPELRPVATGWWGLPDPLIMPLDVLAVLLLAGIFAWALHKKASGLALSLVCVILLLGWQALCVIAAVTVAAELLAWPLCGLRRKGTGSKPADARATKKRSSEVPVPHSPMPCVPPSLLVGVFTLAWLLAWARLVSE